MGFQNISSIGNEEYGTAFWKKMMDDYKKALDESGSTTEIVTNKTSIKNVAKKEMKKIMNSLLNVLEGNYPDTYKSVYIEWGFVKGGY